MDDLSPGAEPESEDGLTSSSSERAFSDAWSVSQGTVDPYGVDPHDNLWWYADGAVWDLGPAEIDGDGDGIADSLTSGVDGSVAVLTDSDGDGRIDRMSVLRSDGSAETVTFDDSGTGWSPTAVGRLD